MKAQIGVDGDSSLVHSLATTAANEADVEQVADLLHGQEKQVWGDAGHPSAQTHVPGDDLQWHNAAWSSAIAKLPDGRALSASAEAGAQQAERAREGGAFVPPDRTTIPLRSKWGLHQPCRARNKTSPPHPVLPQPTPALDAA